MSKGPRAVRFRPDARGVSGKWGRSSPTSEKAQSISVERRARLRACGGGHVHEGAREFARASSVGASWQVNTPSNRGQKTTPSDGVSSSSSRAEIGYLESVAPLDVDQGRGAEKGLPRNAASKTSR